MSARLGSALTPSILSRNKGKMKATKSNDSIGDGESGLYIRATKSNVKDKRPRK